MYRSIMTLNPLSDIRQVSEMLDRVFDTGSPRLETGSEVPMNLLVDIYEADDTIYVKAAVPGIDPKDLDVTLEEGVLTIKGESSQEATREGVRFHRREYRYGAFERSIRLPENVDESAVAAEFKNGMVTVSIPRVMPPKPQVVKVPVKELSDATSTPSTN